MEKKKSSKRLAPQFKRSQFSFKLNTLIIVEIYVIINYKADLIKRFEFDSVNALRFEDRKEIFC